MTDDKTRALIAEGYGWSTADDVYRHATSALDTIRRLTRALSALKVPDGDARERLIEVLRTITPRLHEPLWTNVLGEQADAVLAAFPVLGRDIASEIEAEDEASGPFPDKANAYYEGLRRAAEIARNGR